MDMGFFLTFQRRHVETNEPLTDDTICWIFDTRVAWDNAVAEIKSRKDLCYLNSGSYIDKRIGVGT